MPGSKKQREIYVGNLNVGQITPETLRDLFVSLSQALPAFDARAGPPVHHVQMCQNGMYAFVEMRDEALASTMMKFHGLDVAGRPMKIGRPGGYIEPVTGEVPPLDVPAGVLRELGVAGVASLYRPPPTTAGAADANMLAKKQRELYVGNLHAGVVTAPMLRELLTEPLKAALQVSDAEDAANPIVRSAEIQPDGKFAFVEFRDADAASMALTFFQDMEFCGRPMRLGRPAGYVDLAAIAGGAALPPVAQYANPAPAFLSAPDLLGGAP